MSVRCAVRFRDEGRMLNVDPLDVRQADLYMQPIPGAPTTRRFVDYYSPTIRTEYNCFTPEYVGNVRVDWLQNTDNKGPEHCFIENVKAEPQRQGFGTTALMQELAYMIEKGCKKIYGIPVPSSISFWERTPFKLRRHGALYSIDLEEPAEL